jgi:hypothetical protein
VIVVLHFQPADGEVFLRHARAALSALAARPGYQRGSIGRATDDVSHWIMVTEWESVGAYRRGLGGYEVKLVATPLLAQAVDQPTAFEALVTISDDGREIVRPSDRAVDAD